MRVSNVLCCCYFSVRILAERRCPMWCLCASGTAVSCYCCCEWDPQQNVRIICARVCVNDTHIRYAFIHKYSTRSNVHHSQAVRRVPNGFMLVICSFVTVVAAAVAVAAAVIVMLYRSVLFYFLEGDPVVLSRLEILIRAHSHRHRVCVPYSVSRNSV